MNFENLPDTWKVVRLGRVAEVLKEGINPQNYPYKNFFLYSFEAYDNSRNPEIKQGKDIHSNKILLTQNCVLFARLNPRKGRIWKVKLREDFLSISSTEFIPFAPNTNVNIDYLYWVLKTFVLPAAQRKISGTTKSRERTSKDFLSNLPIPLPPLPEQKRIVEILSLAEELIKKQKEAISLIDKILMAKFLEMFGDPATNPKGWEVKRLGEDELITIETGKRPKGGALKDGEVLSIGGEHINDFGQLEIKDPKYISLDFYNQLTKGKLKTGDVVICKDGAKTGKVAYIHRLPSEYCAVNEHVFIMRGKKEKLNNIYLFYFLLSKEGQRKIRERAHGIIGGIKKDDVYDISVPLPPIELQKEFAQIAEEFEKKREEMQKTLQTLESLFKFLQKKAFTGELTAEWREQNKVKWELPKITERQAILLATLYYYQNLIRKPALITVAMKSAFLLQKESSLNLDYDFIPYKYGPFSKEVYEDIEDLEKNLLVERVKPKKDIEMTEIRLIDEFKDWTERIIDNLSQKIRDVIKVSTEKYGKMELNELLDYVYAKYPEYAVKSKRKRRRR